MKIKPMTILLTMLAGWLNRQQADIIDYLTEENKILREKLGVPSKMAVKNVARKEFLGGFLKSYRKAACFFCL